MNYKITKQVKRKTKRFVKTLNITMIAGAIICVLAGIAFSTGFMLPAFMFALLYFIFSTQSQTEYEYNLEDGVFKIDVIKGKKRRKQVHEFYIKDVEVIAPNWHEAVAMYRKDGGTIRLPKYDYTSYDDNIPFYTMIVMENKTKIKLLLDLDQELLSVFKRMYPQKVYLE